jgi:diaminopimelate epimerase
MACGTGVCAAAAAAVRKGLCDKNTDITVKVLGGDLTVNVSDKGIILTGETVMVYEGEFEY